MLSPTLSNQLTLMGAGDRPQLQGFWRPSLYSSHAVPDYILIQTLAADDNAPRVMLFEVPVGQWPRKLAEGDGAVWKFHAMVSDTIELKRYQPQTALSETTQ